MPSRSQGFFWWYKIILKSFNSFPITFEEWNTHSFITKNPSQESLTSKKSLKSFIIFVELQVIKTAFFLNDGESGWSLLLHKNISLASQQNSVASFSYTTDINGDLF